MAANISRRLFGLLIVVGVLLLPSPVQAQRTTAPQQTGTIPDPGVNASLMVVVRDETGGANSVLALVAISRMEGGMFNQGTTEVGQVQFEGIPPGVYTVKVTAAGYQDTQQTVNVNGGLIIAQFQLRPNSEVAAAAERPPGLPILAPKAQKLVTEIWKSMHENKMDEARASLDQLQKLAPGHPEVNYMYGVYELKMNEPAKAKVYWQMALELYPKHMGALMQLSQADLQQNKPADAMPLLNTAMEVAPTSWRLHAMMAQAYLEQRRYPDSVKEADRAIELGHSEADPVQPLLARALAGEGNKERAIRVLQAYLKAHPDNSDAHRLLDALQAPAAQPPAGNPPGASSPTPPGNGQPQRPGWY